MPVHAGADVQFLEVALNSVFEQKRAADEVVVIGDGPLTPAQLDLLERFGDDHPRLRLITLERPVGLASALQRGLVEARYDWIVRMDSDDISLPNRFERQLEVIATGLYDLVGSAMLEFDGDPRNIVANRRMPTSHDQILRAARRHNPFNHPSMVFSRQIAIAVGGYRDIRFVEDYDLFARMLSAGARAYNMPDALVLFRGGREMIRRRKKLGAVLSEFRLQQNLWRYGLIGPHRMAVNLMVRMSARLIPSFVFERLYRRHFHHANN